jgi:hypothetical protein
MLLVGTGTRLETLGTPKLGIRDIYAPLPHTGMNPRKMIKNI